jgi:muramoyltetrapeptide carboxypeptidase LdcA involved in peptidoglycan recycling
LIKVASEEFNHPEMPIVTNVDFGHTDPQLIMPPGVMAQVDCKNKKFKLIENPLS